ncbi:winged helix-turn-helix transcriptional regulator [Chitinophaga caseinilytica]|uniref:Winged helix-turn-helix transcriptional regulator n=1 Tax=Chitinophaga caseinilytica TaxID=2267521 RepID=A0ABZ2Z4A8_9BACT
MTRIKETSTNYANKKMMEDWCPEVYAASIIGNQWSLAICCFLINGKMRFSELRKKMPGITERMLTIQLRRLEENGVVTRKVYPEVPPRVEYEMTAIGKQLKTITEALEAWGLAHRRLQSKSK